MNPQRSEWLHIAGWIVLCFLAVIAPGWIVAGVEWTLRHAGAPEFLHWPVSEFARAIDAPYLP